MVGHIKYPLCLPTWDKDEILAILEVIQSDRYTCGERVQKFEHAFAEYVGSKYACMVNSGSSANLLAIAALFHRKNGLSLKRGDEVIVPAVSWATTYAPLQQFGLHVKFVDIDPHTLNITPEAIARNISEKTKLVIAVNLLGNPANLCAIQDVLNAQKIPPILMEDNCESMGATHKHAGKKPKFAGTFGLLGTFSTFFSHHISTMEGGLVVTDDEELYHMMLSMRSHGWTRSIPDENALGIKKNDNAFYNSFNFIYPGFNIRPGELNAAIGIKQLEKLPSFLAMREMNREQFEYMMAGHRRHVYIQKTSPWSTTSSFGFAIICKPHVDRDNLVAYLTNAGIEVRPIVAGNFTRNPVIQYYDHSFDQDGLTNADIIHDRGFFIGNHHIDIKEWLIYFDDLLYAYFHR